MLNKLSQYPALVIGLIQAIGVALYIFIFACGISLTDKAHSSQPPVILAVMTFLMIFIISALVNATIVLGYPIFLIMKGQLRRAISVIVWTALSLIIFASTIGLIAVLLSKPTGN